MKTTKWNTYEPQLIECVESIPYFEYYASGFTEKSLDKDKIQELEKYFKNNLSRWGIEPRIDKINAKQKDDQRNRVKSRGDYLYEKPVMTKKEKRVRGEWLKLMETAENRSSLTYG